MIFASSDDFEEFIKALLFWLTALFALAISASSDDFACLISLSLSVNLPDNVFALAINAFNCCLIDLFSLSTWVFALLAFANACCNAWFAAIMSDLFEDSETDFLASFALVKSLTKAE